MNKRIIGLLLIIRALTPLIVLFIIILSGYLIINDLKEHLNEEMTLVIDSINSSKKSLASVQGGISEITSSFADVTNTLSSALKPIDDAFNSISERIKNITFNQVNINLNLNLNNIFDPLFTPLNNVKEGVNSFGQSIDELIQPMKESVSILQNDLIKWIQNMIILLIIIFLLVLNYFVIPLMSDLKKGLDLLFNRSNVEK
ncbi:MAG TPA: hypothetical protein VE956_10615 [Nodularia sp. (in: cyanobacteria)]|nr:hypothetical protein [Nodularia sp. (in: cyanobacteria)]